MYPTPQLHYNLFGISYFQEIILSSSTNLTEGKKKKKKKAVFFKSGEKNPVILKNKYNLGI